MKIKGTFMRLDQVNNWLESKGHSILNINGSFIRVEVIQKMIPPQLYRELQCDVPSTLRF